MKVTVENVTFEIDEKSTLAKLLRAKMARSLGLKPQMLRQLVELGLSIETILPKAPQTEDKK